MSLGAMSSNRPATAATEARKGAAADNKTLLDSMSSTDNKLFSSRVKVVSPGKKRPKSPRKPQQKATTEQEIVSGRPAATTTVAGAVIYQQVDPDWMALTPDQPPAKPHRARHSDRAPALQNKALRSASFHQKYGATRTLSPSHRAAQRTYERAYQSPAAVASSSTAAAKARTLPPSRRQAQQQETNETNSLFQSKTPVASKKKAVPRIYARADSAPCLNLGTTDADAKDETDVEEDELFLFEHNTQQTFQNLPEEPVDADKLFVTPPRTISGTKTSNPQHRRFSSSAVEVDTSNHLILARTPAMGRCTPLQRGIEVHHSDSSADSVIGQLLASVTAMGRLLESVDASMLETHQEVEKITHSEAEEDENDARLLLNSPPRRIRNRNEDRVLRAPSHYLLEEGSPVPDRVAFWESIIAEDPVEDIIFKSGNSRGGSSKSMDKEVLPDSGADGSASPKKTTSKHVVKKISARKTIEADGSTDSAHKRGKKKITNKTEPANNQSKKRKDEKKKRTSELASGSSLAAEEGGNLLASAPAREKSPKRQRHPSPPSRSRAASKEEIPLASAPNREKSPKRQRHPSPPPKSSLAAKEENLSSTSSAPVRGKSPERIRNPSPSKRAKERSISVDPETSSKDADAVMSKIEKSAKPKRSKSPKRIVSPNRSPKLDDEEKLSPSQKSISVVQNDLNWSELQALLLDIHGSESATSNEARKSLKPEQGAKKRVRNHSMGSLLKIEETTEISAEAALLIRRKSGPSSFGLYDETKRDKATKEVSKTSKDNNTQPQPPRRTRSSHKKKRDQQQATTPTTTDALKTKTSPSNGVSSGSVPQHQSSTDDKTSSKKGLQRSGHSSKARRRKQITPTDLD